MRDTLESLRDARAQGMSEEGNTREEKSLSGFFIRVEQVRESGVSGKALPEINKLKRNTVKRRTRLKAV